MALFVCLLVANGSVIQVALGRQPVFALRGQLFIVDTCRRQGNSRTLLPGRRIRRTSAQAFVHRLRLDDEVS